MRRDEKKKGEITGNWDERVNCGNCDQHIAMGNV